jgi:hypothetical protein
MSEIMVSEILAAHADHLVGNKANGEDYLNLFPAYQTELAPLLRIAELVKATVVPATPSPEFVAGLKQDLLVAAMQRANEQKGERQASFLRRRVVLIAAAAGSALSVTAVVAALLWRRRSIARA